jgi:hypothetical protein
LHERGLLPNRNWTPPPRSTMAALGRGLA